MRNQNYESRYLDTGGPLVIDPSGFGSYLAVFQIHRNRMFLGLLDPDLNP
jgi:hypothetical protein